MISIKDEVVVAFWQLRSGILLQLACEGWKMSTRASHQNEDMLLLERPVKGPNTQQTNSFNQESQPGSYSLPVFCSVLRVVLSQDSQGDATEFQRGHREKKSCVIAACRRKRMRFSCMYLYTKHKIL